MSLLLRNGTVHSVGDPFATALLVEAGTVAWIGQESTADTLDATSQVDLDGLLLTPAFADGWAPAAGGAQAPRLGIVGAHAPLGAGPWPGVDIEELLPRPEWERAGGQPGILVADPGGLRDLVEALGPRTPVGAVQVADQDELAGVIDDLAGRTPRIGAQLRLHVPGHLRLDASQVESLAATPAALVVAGMDGFDLPLAQLVAAGVPVAFGSGPAGWRDPWSTLTAAVSTGPAPLTARAAFNAHSRQVWRLGLPAPFPRGTLAVGAPASLAAWRVDALAVQTPDERIASWSTDPRAGTPLLPMLGPGEVLPTHAFTIADGAITAWNEQILPRPA